MVNIKKYVPRKKGNKSIWDKKRKKPQPYTELEMAEIWQFNHVKPINMKKSAKQNF